MAYRLKFSARALREIGEAHEWYEAQPFAVISFTSWRLFTMCAIRADGPKEECASVMAAQNAPQVRSEPPEIVVDR